MKIKFLILVALVFCSELLGERSIEFINMRSMRSDAVNNNPYVNDHDRVDVEVEYAGYCKIGTFYTGFTTYKKTFDVLWPRGARGLDIRHINPDRSKLNFADYGDTSYDPCEIQSIKVTVRYKKDPAKNKEFYYDYHSDLLKSKPQQLYIYEDGVESAPRKGL